MAVDAWEDDESSGNVALVTMGVRGRAKGVKEVLRLQCIGLAGVRTDTYVSAIVGDVTTQFWKRPEWQWC